MCLCGSDGVDGNAWRLAHTFDQKHHHETEKPKPKKKKAAPAKPKAEKKKRAKAVVEVDDDEEEDGGWVCLGTAICVDVICVAWTDELIPYHITRDDAEPKPKPKKKKPAAKVYMKHIALWFPYTVLPSRSPSPLACTHIHVHTLPPPQKPKKEAKAHDDEDEEEEEGGSPKKKKKVGPTHMCVSLVPCLIILSRTRAASCCRPLIHLSIHPHPHTHGHHPIPPAPTAGAGLRGQRGHRGGALGARRALLQGVSSSELERVCTQESLHI